MVCAYNFNYDAKLEDFISEKDAENWRMESAEASIKRLNFNQKWGEKIGAFEIAFERDNNIDTWKEAYRFLEDYSINKKYRAKDLFDYWAFNGAIYRKQLDQRFVDSIPCRICGSVNSKYQDVCARCHNPLGA